jgi:hypothetical protein
MTAKRFKDVFGNAILLTEERKRHILLRHPEVKEFLHLVGEALADPDVVVRSRLDPTVSLYHKKHKGYVVVVVKTTEQFVLTAYTSVAVKQGEVIWKKT